MKIIINATKYQNKSFKLQIWKILTIFTKHNCEVLIWNKIKPGGFVTIFLGFYLEEIIKVRWYLGYQNIKLMKCHSLFSISFLFSFHVFSHSFGKHILAGHFPNWCKQKAQVNNMLSGKHWCHNFLKDVSVFIL